MLDIMSGRLTLNTRGTPPRSSLRFVSPPRKRLSISHIFLNILEKLIEREFYKYEDVRKINKCSSMDATGER